MPPDIKPEMRVGFTHSLRCCAQHLKGKMNYAELSAAGHAIGSGKVESANKLLVSMRMKRCGQKWTQEGGQAVMDLRSLDKSGRFDAAWEHVMKAFKPSEIRFAEPVSDLPLAA